MESDHASVSVEVEEGSKELLEGEGKKEVGKIREVFSWSEEDVEVFKAQTEEIEEDENTEDTVENKWDKLKKWISKAGVKKERKRKSGK